MPHRHHVEFDVAKGFTLLALGEQRSHSLIWQPQCVNISYLTRIFFIASHVCVYFKKVVYTSFSTCFCT